MAHPIPIILLFSLGGFFLGGVLWSALIPRVFFGVDVRAESRDGNPGSANVFMRCGFFAGIICLALDLAKGFLPVYTAYRFVGEEGTHRLLFSLVLAAPVLGHLIAPYEHYARWRKHLAQRRYGAVPAREEVKGSNRLFLGGKGIATAFGVLLGLLPISYVVVLLAAPYAIFTVFRILRHRARSIVVFALFGAMSLPYLLYTGYFSLFPGCLTVSLAVIARHLADHSKASPPLEPILVEEQEEKDEG